VDDDILCEAWVSHVSLNVNKASDITGSVEKCLRLFTVKVVVGVVQCEMAPAVPCDWVLC
jgi:hypothetical protein